MKNKLILLFILAIVSPSCTKEIPVIWKRWNDSMITYNAINYYYCYLPNVFNVIDTCYVIGYLTDDREIKLHINHNAPIRHDTIYIFPRNLIGDVIDYQLNYFYHGKEYEINVDLK